jgi:hypothetical protein
METSVSVLAADPGFIQPLQKEAYTSRHITHLSCPAVSH